MNETKQAKVEIKASFFPKIPPAAAIGLSIWNIRWPRRAESSGKNDLRGRVAHLAKNLIHP